MNKIILSITVLLLFSCLFAKEPTHPGFYTKGKFIYDPNGEKIILRGVNKMVVWTDPDGVPSFSEIAKTGANVVRIVWTIKDGTMEGLDVAITNCIKEKMIPMIELHDATCKWEKELFDKITAYWTDKKMVSIIKKHEKYLMINYGNEIGGWNISLDDYEKTYINIIKKMRKAGIRVPIIIDMFKCGQDLTPYLVCGENIVKADPEQNVIFSVHMWWTDGSPERVRQAFMAAEYVNAPLIVGEFAHKGVGCSGDIPYRTIIEECYNNETGWLAWEWGPGNTDCNEMDMTKDGTYNTLYGWGKEVAVDSKYSIKNTAKKTKFLQEIKIEEHETIKNR